MALGLRETFWHAHVAAILTIPLGLCWSGEISRAGPDAALDTVCGAAQPEGGGSPPSVRESPELVQQPAPHPLGTRAADARIAAEDGRTDGLEAELNALLEETIGVSDSGYRAQILEDVQTFHQLLERAELYGTGRRLVRWSGRPDFERCQLREGWAPALFDAYIGALWHKIGQHWSSHVSLTRTGYAAARE